MSNLAITSVPPKYGENYDAGWIGFTYTKGTFLSIGIAWFERWDRMSDIKASHAFVVANEHACIEAIPEGVQTTLLADKFNDPKCQVFFRKPRGYTTDMGRRIVSAASELLGRPYDFSSIAGLMLGRTIVGRFINKLARNLPDRIVTKLFNSNKAYFCSEVCAYALRKQPELAGLGCIKKDPDRLINPQLLLEDNEVFADWKKERVTA